MHDGQLQMRIVELEAEVRRLAVSEPDKRHPETADELRMIRYGLYLVLFLLGSILVQVWR